MTHTDITAAIFHSQSKKKKAFLYFIHMWFLSEYDYSFETVISPREGMCFVFYLCQMLMKHEHPICCSTSLEFVFSATTSLMTSAHSAIAFLPILPKWNFTKGLADRGKLNHSPPKWDASTPQLFSYRESLSSPERSSYHHWICATIKSRVWKAAWLVLQIPVPHLKCPGANLQAEQSWTGAVWYMLKNTCVFIWLWLCLY